MFDKKRINYQENIKRCSKGLKIAFKKGIDKMNCKESLKEYIDKDEIYQDYKQDKLMNCSDFDKFCIQHCKDIEELLEENLELEQALDEIEKIILKATTDEETGKDLGYSDKIPYDDLLEIIQKTKGE